MLARVSGLGRALPEPLGRTATVSDLERTLAGHPGTPLVPVYDEHGQISALVLPDAIVRIPPAQRSSGPDLLAHRAVVEPSRVHPEESVGTVLARLGSGGSWRALVTDGSVDARRALLRGRRPGGRARDCLSAARHLPACPRPVSSGRCLPSRVGARGSGCGGWSRRWSASAGGLLLATIAIALAVGYLAGALTLLDRVSKGLDQLAAAGAERADLVVEGEVAYESALEQTRRLVPAGLAPSSAADTRVSRL
ncbi:MAG: hypothetical protein V9E94_04635 [Microthrixaceae bacterium]